MARNFEARIQSLWNGLKIRNVEPWQIGQTLGSHKSTGEWHTLGDASPDFPIKGYFLSRSFCSFKGLDSGLWWLENIPSAFQHKSGGVGHKASWRGCNQTHMTIVGRRVGVAWLSLAGMKVFSPPIVSGCQWLRIILVSHQQTNTLFRRHYSGTSTSNDNDERRWRGTQRQRQRAIGDELGLGFSTPACHWYLFFFFRWLVFLLISL